MAKQEAPVIENPIRLGRVGLGVADLERSVAFYRTSLGMRVFNEDEEKALLGAADEPLLLLERRPGARRDPRQAGLFHVAYLLPDRPALGRMLDHLRTRKVVLQGASDHGVSEALYLADPDGHGIEIYADRPPSAWYEDGRIEMPTRPMDTESVLAAAGDTSFAGLESGTRIGHIHLETQDLAATRRFYTERLGFDITVELPKAVFLSRDGYHHHVAANVWNARQEPQSLGPQSAGLLFYEIGLAPADLTRARQAFGSDRLTDPSGVELRVAPA
jgi:catechol 2,3-dioxygenase